MSIQIEIVDALPDVREGTSRNGDDYKIVTQKIYLHKTGEKYPDRMILSLEDEKSAYPVGMYELDMDKLITRGQYDSLDLVRYPVLTPIKKSHSPS